LRYQAERGDYGPGDKDELVEQVLGLYQGEKATSWDRTFPDGRTLRFNMAPTPEGGYVTIARDITARKRAEAGLAEKEAQLRLALDNMPGGMMLVDRDLNCVLFNSQYSQLLEFPDDLVRVGGSSRDELRYQAERGDFGPGDKDDLIEHSRRVALLESGKPAWIVDVTKDPNFPRAKLAEEIGVRAGFAVPVLVGNRVEAVLEFFAATAVEPDEALMQVLGNIGAQVGRAVERKRAEEELARKEAQFHLALDHMQGGMRPAVTSRSNWANESSMLRVNLLVGL
jgi:PAS domain-containing protein